MAPPPETNEETPDPEMTDLEMARRSFDLRRRGNANVREPTNNKNLKPLKYIGDALVGRGFSGWFRPEMRRRTTGFWPRWCEVPPNVKEDMFNAVFKEYYLVDKKDMYRAYGTLMSQWGTLYRKMISDMKNKSLQKVNSKNPTMLVNAPRPGHLTDDVWHRFIQHWCTAEQEHKSKTNKENRNKLPGASHGFGRRGTAERLNDMDEQGLDPSLVALVSDRNKKKDKSGKPTGEVYNPKTEKIIEDYSKLVKEKYGDDRDPRKGKTDYDLWLSVPDVIQSGRVYGYGNTTNVNTRRNPEEASTSSGIPRSYRVSFEEMLEEQAMKTKADQEARDLEFAKMLQETERRTVERMEARMEARFKAMEEKYMNERRSKSRASGIVFRDHEVVRTTPGVPQTQPSQNNESDEDCDDHNDGDDDDGGSDGVGDDEDDVY